MKQNPLSPYQRLLQRVIMRVRPATLAAVVKRLLGVRRVAVDTEDGCFNIDPVSLLGLALTRQGCHEAGMRSTLHHFLGPGKTFVDLGANEGYFTVIAARLCAPGGRVVAIEPQQRLLQVISDNVKLNSSPGVHVVNAAVTHTSGLATLHLTASTSSGGSSLHNPCKYPLPTQQIATLTLGELLDREGLSHIDLMKVDIEGFEYEALLGSPEVFREHRVAAMALELHPSILAARHKPCEDILQMLAACGYEMTCPFGHTVWIAPVK
jgi:FkbM family methyltransferase